MDHLTNIDALAGPVVDDAPLPEAPETAEASTSKRRASWGDVARVRRGLQLARQGKRFSVIYKAVLKLRQHLEAAVAGPDGKLTLLQEARVQSAVRLEQNARSAELSLRDDRLEPEEAHKLREAICRWSCQRDGIIAELLAGKPSGGGFDFTGDLNWRRGAP